MNQHEDTTFLDLEKSGLKYIENQKNYLFYSALFPFYSIIVQIINIVYIISTVRRPPLPGVRPLPLVDVLTPFLILLIFSSFAFIKFVFLMIWKKKVTIYQKFSNNISNTPKKCEEKPLHNIDLTEEDNLEDFPPPVHKGNFNPDHPMLIQLYYDLIDHMRLIRQIFIILNVAFFLYLQWFIRFFLVYFHILPPIHAPQNDLFRVLNTITEFGLLIYMIVEWRHFLKWNRKLRKIEAFEETVFSEINL